MLVKNSIVVDEIVDPVGIRQPTVAGQFNESTSEITIVNRQGGSMNE